MWVAPATVRGLVSRVVTPSSTRDYSYDQTGTVKRVTDELGRYVETTNSQANDYAVPAAVKPNGDSSMQETYAWNTFLGLTQDSGPNGAVSSISYDANARPQSVTSPHGAVTNYVYTNSPPTVTATTNLHWVKTTMDGLGRTIKVERGHNGGGGGTKTTVETEYEPCACSPFGKVKRVSLPYAPGGSVLWTTYTYDGLGRTVSVAQPNSAGTSTYLYEGNAVTVTDAAGKWRKYESDAFGSVTKTIEPNPAGGANWETTYAYDMLGRRTSLTMTRGATTQTRTWNYVGWTGRLSSEVHPETGTTSYSYHADGKLSAKTLASGKTVSYTYDGFGRLSTVTDSTSTCNGASFTYDEAGKNAIGRLSKIRYSGVSCTLGQYNPPGYDFMEEFWYTAGGLTTKKKFYLWDGTRSFKSEEFDLNYGYNNEGQLTSENLYLGTAGYYPYLRGYYYDDLGRVIGMTGSPTVTNVSYNAADQMTSITHSGIAETRQYSALYQLTRITVAGQMDLEYRYSSSANNGQITQMKNWISGEEVNYTYDAVGRLSAASTTGTEWGLSFTYDGFGNKTAQTVTKGSAPAMSVGVDGNNRVVGWTYDAAGFPTAVSGQYSSIGWDAQGRMQGISVQGGTMDTFVYDPGNRRVWRNSQLHLRGLDGKVVALFNFNSSTETFSLVTTYAWFAGRKVEQKIDRLGTVQNGSRFYPYGEESASTSNDTDKFATYWRDSNSGLDYAVNRYYKANTGRFMSPDPYRWSAGVHSSGSWNRFAYVEGDPVNRNDPYGLVYDEEFDGPMSAGERARMSAMEDGSYGVVKDVHGRVLEDVSYANVQVRESKIGVEGAALRLVRATSTVVTDMVPGVKPNILTVDPPFGDSNMVMLSQPQPMSNFFADTMTNIVAKDTGIADQVTLLETISSGPLDGLTSLGTSSEVFPAFSETELKRSWFQEYITKDCVSTMWRQVSYGILDGALSGSLGGGILGGLPGAAVGAGIGAMAGAVEGVLNVVLCDALGHEYNK